MKKSQNSAKIDGNPSDSKVKVSLAAINPYQTSNLTLPIEKKAYGGSRITWGSDDRFANYLYALYESCSTLHSIIESVVDYISGDEISTENIVLEDVKEELVRDIAYSLAIYGGFALEVLRNKLGGVAQVNCLDMRCVRSSEDNSTFYYSKDMRDKGFTNGKCTVIPAFNPDDKAQAQSIYYHKNNRYSVYPQSPFGPATIYAEIDTRIGQFQLNETYNGFTGDWIVNMNNGVPTDEILEEVTSSFEERFCGLENTRPLICWNQDKEHEMTIQKLGNDKEFVERYNTTSDRAKQELYTCYRMNPLLAGLNNASTGFSTEEFSHCFKLFNRTTIAPLQKTIISSLDYILGTEKSLEIKPFSISFDDAE